MRAAVSARRWLQHHWLGIAAVGLILVLVPILVVPQLAPWQDKAADYCSSEPLLRNGTTVSVRFDYLPRPSYVCQYKQGPSLEAEVRIGLYPG